MTKSELIQAIASSLQHLPARDVEVVVNTMFDSMTNALQGGDRIEIRGFGSFSVRNRRSRQGRNPKRVKLFRCQRSGYRFSRLVTNSRSASMLLRVMRVTKPLKSS